MKNFLILIIICRTLYHIRFYQLESEKLFYLKCIIYILVSSIQSVILGIIFPLGAVIMFCITLIDYKNKHVKYRMILVGTLTIFISLISFEAICNPFQRAYLMQCTQNVTHIDLYAYNNTDSSYLLSISEQEKIDLLLSQITTATPIISDTKKELHTNLSYKLILHQEDEQTTELNISPYSLTPTTFYLGNYHIGYTSNTLIPTIHSLYSNTPSILTINTSKESSINITSPLLLNNLWRLILWGPRIENTSVSDNDFTIPSYLFFDQYLGCKLSFTADFNYALIDHHKIIELSDYLQTMFNEQYILSQTDYVNTFTHYEPAHTSTPTNLPVNFFIQQDPNGLYYGLYMEDYKTSETILLHSVSSVDTEFFILKHPYILLLDEQEANSYYLMLINLNIPEKHRYISKNENLLSRSISLCPYNTKFSYIIDKGEVSNLYLVSDYYRSPKVIASGHINDSLFLTDNYLVFTQVIDDQSFLCIYSYAHQQVIKYVYIPGDIILTEAKDGKLTFAVQTVDGLNLKESLFCIDNHFNIYKQEKE